MGREEKGFIELKDNPNKKPGGRESPEEKEHGKSVVRAFVMGNGYPFQYSCLENPMDRGAWQATVHGVTRVGHDLVHCLCLSLIQCVLKISQLSQ